MKNGMPLKIEDYICEGDQIYFVASEPCIIGQYDRQMDLVNILLDYSQTVSIPGGFTRIVKYHHKIYCIPGCADNIYCYNLISNRFYSLDIPDVLFQKMPSRKIIEAIEVKGYIYCVCRSPHFVLVIDAETDAYEINYNNEIMGEHEFFTLQVKDDCIMYPFFHNLIVSFDIGKRVFQIQTLYDKDTQDNWNYIFHYFYDDAGCIWISNFRGEVYSIENRELNKIEFPPEYRINYEKLNCKIYYMINEMLYVDGKIYFILADTDGFRILQYVISDKKFKWIETGQHQEFERISARYDICKISNDRLYIYRYDDNMFYIWNNQKGAFNEFTVLIPGDKAAALQMDIPQNEDLHANLEFYIAYLQNYKKDKDKNSEKKDNGKIIYSSI